MIEVGIYGATGYTGIELIHLLHRHPAAQIVFATARSAAGQPLNTVFPTLLDLPLVAAEEVDPTTVDVVFCCLPHGASAPTAQQALEAGARVIDLSADFRLRNPADYERWYGKPHPASHLLETAVYGMPEIYRESIRAANLVANPGCYPTTVILALYPLVRAGLLLSDQPIIADSKSGVSGAGRSLSLKTHFSETHENFSAYNIGRRHRHLAEMEQETGAEIIFSPHLLPVVRGILSTIYVTVKPGTPPAIVRSAYRVYDDEPFTHLLPEGSLPELRHVVGTNQCVIGLEPVDVERGRYILVSAEDNLVKGASGQAVHNMNLMYDLDETAGLL
jgi:N-acetyl-gamma-glutamyl-phosphate reductase